MLDRWEDEELGIMARRAKRNWKQVWSKQQQKKKGREMREGSGKENGYKVGT